MAYPMMRAATHEPRRRVVRAADVVVAAAVAGIVSGAPSTLHAVVTGRSPLDAVRAAASLAPTWAGRSAGAELAAGLAVHAGLSVVWTAVLAGVVPRRHPVLWGAVAGAGIAALDLGIVGRRNAAITELPLMGQAADHVVFGAAVGWVLARRAPPTG
jgi:hypothetical protein